MSGAEAADSAPRGVWQRSLANSELRDLLAATVVSQTGDWLYSVALVVFVFDATHSVAWVAASVIARQVAFMSCSAIGGALADRFDRRRWMIAINLGQAGVLAAMAVVAVAHGPTALMIVFAFGAAALAAGYHPAVFASIPAIVGENDLAAANAVVSTIEQTASAVGPALGALVVALSSSSLAFAIDAATFVAAASILSRLRDRGDDGDGSEEVVAMRDQLIAGVRAIRDSPSAVVVIAMVAGVLVAYGFEQVLYVAVSARRLGTGASGVGVMCAAYGAGGIVASLIAGRLAGRERPVPILAATFISSGVVLAALAVITSPALAYAVFFVGGGAFVIFEVVSVTVLQRAVAPELMGRVYGILMTLGSAAALLGSLVAPALANGIGLRIALVVGGTIPFVVLALVAPRLARLDRTTAARARELGPTVAVLSRLGVFEGAPVPSLERLAATLTEQRVSAGTVVVREDDAADAFFVVRAGTFDVTVQRDSATIKIDELHGENWFGEIGVIERIPRTATVTATTPGVVWRIEGNVFLDSLEQLPRLPNLLTSLMTARIERAHSPYPMGHD